MREKVKDFARMQLSNPPSGPAGEEYRKQYPCPPYKIIILDEADSMTQDAQSALRRTMETYSKITRFCLVCNYVTRIIDPLASRCSKFRFKALNEGDAGKRLRDIARLEGVIVEEGGVEMLLRCCEGDLRRGITFLQSAARLVGAGGTTNATSQSEKKRKRTTIADDEDEDEGSGMDLDSTSPAATKSNSRQITITSISEIAGVIPQSTLQPLLTALQPPTTSKGQPTLYTRVAPIVENLIAEGWSATQLLAQLYEALVLVDESGSDAAKGGIVGVFSEADKRLVDGADEHLVVLDVCLRSGGILAGK